MSQPFSYPGGFKGSVQNSNFHELQSVLNVRVLTSVPTVPKFWVSGVRHLLVAVCT